MPKISGAQREKYRIELAELSSIISLKLGELRPQQNYCHPGLKDMLVQLAGDPLWKAQGEFISRFMRLPWGGGEQTVIAEIINGDGPYRADSDRLRVQCRVKNISRLTAQIFLNREDFYRIDTLGMATAEVVDSDFFYHNIEPGETIDLDSNQTYGALGTYSLAAASLDHQRRWLDAHPGCDRLREIAYRVEFWNKRTSSIEAIASDDWSQDETEVETPAPSRRKAS